MRRLVGAESLLEPCKISVKTQLTVMPGKRKINSNLSLLSPYVEFTDWAKKPLKNHSENFPIKSKSTIIKISPTNLFSNFLEENNFQNSDVEDGNENLDLEMDPGSIDSSILQCKMSVKDIIFIYSTIIQLSENQKKQNKMKILTLKVSFFFFLFYFSIF